MNEDVAVDLVAHKEAETAGRVEPFDPALDSETVGERLFFGKDFDGHRLFRRLAAHANGLVTLRRFSCDRRRFGTRLTHAEPIPREASALHNIKNDRNQAKS